MRLAQKYFAFSERVLGLRGIDVQMSRCALSRRILIQEASVRMVLQDQSAIAFDVRGRARWLRRVIVLGNNFIKHGSVGNFSGLMAMGDLGVRKLLVRNH